MTEYDYIIVGAGSAGCVLAHRLSADPRRRVLLLEAGGADRSLLIRVPIGYGRTFNDPRYNWMYETEPEPALNNRRQFWPRGKVLGGSSSINAMVYVRGQPADFDDWAAAGNPGWSWRDVLPYFIKFEDHAWGASAYHGAGGPVHVSDESAERAPAVSAPSCVPARSSAFRAPRTSTARSHEGAGLWQVTIKDGVRVSSASAYLAAARRRANLEVQTQALATRVLFSGTRASGVEYLQAGRDAHRAGRRRGAGVRRSHQFPAAAGALRRRQRHAPARRSASRSSPIPRRWARDCRITSGSPTSIARGCRRSITSSHRFFGKVRAAWRYALTRRGPLAMSVNQAGAFVRSRPGLVRAEPAPLLQSGKLQHHDARLPAPAAEPGSLPRLPHVLQYLPPDEPRLGAHPLARSAPEAAHRPELPDHRRGRAGRLRRRAPAAALVRDRAAGRRHRIRARTGQAGALGCGSARGLPPACRLGVPCQLQLRDGSRPAHLGAGCAPAGCAASAGCAWWMHPPSPTSPPATPMHPP